MFSADDPGAGPNGPGPTGELPGGEVHSQLVEALVLLLIEKGVLTKNDALSVVQTVAEVQRGLALEGRKPLAQTQANLDMLQLMYGSFEALEERSGVRQADWGNVLPLRPPIHGDRPEFPREE